MSYDNITLNECNSFQLQHYSPLLFTKLINKRKIKNFEDETIDSNFNLYTN